MKYVLDTHMHTVASGHAYSTLNEMYKAAVDKGLELVAITDHGPAMAGGTTEGYFNNLRVIDKDYYFEKYGGTTKLLLGVELNILPTGEVDLKDDLLRKLDIVIASMHNKALSKAENTKNYIQVLKNPYVNIIGHPDDGRFEIDYDELIRAVKYYGKIIELNNHSLAPDSPRMNARENDLKILDLCAKYEQPIVANSDAHVESAVGQHGYAYALLEKVKFPEKLVINTSVSKLYALLHMDYEEHTLEKLA